MTTLVFEEADKKVQQRINSEPHSDFSEISSRVAETLEDLWHQVLQQPDTSSTHILTVNLDQAPSLCFSYLLKIQSSTHTWMRSTRSTAYRDAQFQLKSFWIKITSCYNDHMIKITLYHIQFSNVEAGTQTPASQDQPAG